MEIGGINLKWLGHSGFLIENSKIIYIDPYEIKEDLPKADIILLTHGHNDHCSIHDISKIAKEGTKIFMTADAQSKVLRIPKIRMFLVSPGEEYDLGGVKISTFPAYNIDKSFHLKEEAHVGYLIKTNDVLIYHAGDTDNIPEMQKLTGYCHKGKEFVALLPVGGRYTMTAEEAADAACLIKPTVAVPMHYGSIVGGIDDAEEFKDLCEMDGVKVEILEKE